MGISCPSCGGKMVFDISRQLLRCSYCDTQKTIEEYKAQNEAEVQKTTYDSYVFTCRNCGAELTAPDEQAVSYCSYCGSEQMLTAKHEELLRPKKIIPFLKTKQQAMEEYGKAMKGKLYVPKELKDPQFLEGFRGIYLPYYSYNAVIPGKDVVLTGHANYTVGSYDYEEDYNVHASLGGKTRGIDFDASASFDDTLANDIAPFESKDLKDFHEGYLAGLYADKATSSGSVYIQAAEELAVDSVYTDLEGYAKHLKLDRAGTLADNKTRLGITAVDCEISYFPVWFLTWRNKERVAYSVMNGQTGRITMDIPVSRWKFLLVSFIAAAVLFGLLSVLPMFIVPKALCSIAAIILVISSILLQRELGKIYDIENHVYDYGDTQHTAQKKAMKTKGISESEDGKKEKKGKSKAGSWLGCLFPILIILFWSITAITRGVAFLGELISGKPVIFFIAAFVFQVILSILMIRSAARIQRKTAIIPAIIAPLILLAGIVIIIINSPYDFWYYGTALACLAAVILNCISSMNYFNYLATRPVPNFFRREGADNEK